MGFQAGTSAVRESPASIRSHTEVVDDYEEVKAAILRRYDINEETYRQRFRAAKGMEGETYRETVIRLQDLGKKWARNCRSVDELLDIVVTEQLVSTLPREIHVWVGERKPKDSEETAQLADDYLLVRKSVVEQGGKKDWGRSGKRQYHSCGEGGH